MKLLSLFRKFQKHAPLKKETTNVDNSINKQNLFKAFAGCEDIKIEELHFGENDDIHVLYIYSEGLCDTKLLHNEILPDLTKWFDDKRVELLNPTTLINEWHKQSPSIEKDLASLITNVFQGQFVLFIGNIETAYCVNISNPPQRKPEEANTEITIRGPRDDFIEDITINLALIRKRLRTNSLKYEERIIGERSQTKIGLFFFDDIIRPEVLSEVRRRLDNIKIDAISASNQLEELITETSYPLLPVFQYTGRPDFAVESLLSGRFVIVVDGLPTVIIGPTNFLLLLKSGEDSSIHYLYNSFERLLRLAGTIIGIFLPGFWIALTAYHQDQLPLTLVSTLSQAREGVPLPTPLEALIMLLLFELFREAGMRLPMSIGQVLGIVGALIIGDAAIRAGVTSPAMVMIVATSSVGTFTLVNHSLQGIFGVLRVFILICASFTGIFGFLIGTFILLLYTANIRSFGLPYLAPLSPLHFQDLISAVFRPSAKQKKRRPNFFQSDDSHRQGDSS